MEDSDKLHILQLLKARNDKEQSFTDIIRYSRKLLEKLDYAQKENALKNFPAILSEQCAQESPNSSKAADQSMKTNLEILQRNLAESHSKISGLAEQVINLKDNQDRLNVQLSKRTSDLEKTQEDLMHTNELCKNLQTEVIALKRILQNKLDEYDALNITFSCIENQKNELEIENRKLRSQLSVLDNAKERSSSTESFEKSFESISSHASASSNKSATIADKRKSGSNPKLSVKSPSPKMTSKSPNPTANISSDNLAPNVVLPEVAKFQFIAHDSAVNAILWLPSTPKETSYIITGGADRRLKFWEVKESAKLLKSARDCNSAIMSIDVDPESGSVLCASGDFASRVWTIEDFILRHTLHCSGRVMSAKFISQTFAKIATGSADMTLKLWDFPQKICTLTYHTQSPVNDLISKHPHSIISAHCDSKVRFWDPRAKSEVASIQTGGAVTSLDVARNGNQLLVSELDNKLKIFDVRTNKPMQTMSARTFQIACNWTRSKLSPDGKYCVCGSENGSVFVWNSNTGVLERELKGHKSSVNACSWSYCGAYLASCEKDGNCIVWSRCK